MFFLLQSGTYPKARVSSISQQAPSFWLPVFNLHDTQKQWKTQAIDLSDHPVLKRRGGENRPYTRLAFDTPLRD